MLSKFTVFTGLKQAKFCQTGCFGIGAVAYVIPQVPLRGDSRSLGRSKCLPTRCKLLENLTRSLLLALSKIGGKYSNSVMTQYCRGTNKGSNGEGRWG